MKKFALVTGLVLSSSAHAEKPNAHGHSHGPGGHSHGPAKPAIEDDDVVKQRALDEKARLIEAGKVDASWAKISEAKVEKKQLKKKWEWLATFENAEATKDKTLYIFLKPSGEFVAANFTGK